MHHGARGGNQSHHFGGGGGGIHEPQARPPGGFGRDQAAVHHALLPDFLDIAQRLFLNGGQTAENVALGRLGIGKVIGLVGDDEVVVVAPHLHELGGNFRSAAALGHQMLASGYFRGFPEQQGIAVFIQLVEGVAHGGIGRDAGGGVGFAALAGYHQFLDHALLALEAGGPLHQLLGLAGCGGHGIDVAVLLDGETEHGLAGLGDAVGDHPGPFGFDADDDHGGHIGVAADADQRAEMKLKIGSELEAAIVVRQREGALHMIFHREAGRVGKVVEGQENDVVAHPDASVLTPVSHNFLLGQIHDDYHLLVLTL